MRQRIDHLGPIRVADVEAAQSELVALAQRLAQRGRMALPDQRLTVAV